MKTIKLTESDINRIVGKIIAENEMEEGIFDSVKNTYQGLKGVWRGEGYDYYKYMSSMKNTLQSLDNADKPNFKLMGELQRLKGLINSSKMPSYKKAQLMRYIDESKKYFDDYRTSIDGIKAIITSHM